MGVACADPRVASLAARFQFPRRARTTYDLFCSFANICEARHSCIWLGRIRLRRNRFHIYRGLDLGLFNILTLIFCNLQLEKDIYGMVIISQKMVADLVSSVIVFCLV